ncbi:hypothetical protein EXN66_Car007322 [Channa argus]|uniref:Uncharacterized protein n=1 Tax=Channa argus TaxID=215402 RepID=A0A6G1PN53_CHAAH|nr:hypothetical protein EXN66_Car007322 [Channa argus]
MIHLDLTVVTDSSFPSQDEVNSSCSPDVQHLPGNICISCRGDSEANSSYTIADS